LQIGWQRKQPGGAASLFLLLLGVLVCNGCGQSMPQGRGQADQPPAASRSSSGPADRSPDRSTDRYDLGRDEQRGGHSLARHVARSDEQLQERLRREHISAASTWTDRETAETTVAQALRSERGRIESWMQRGFPRANLALHYRAGHTIGRSLQQGESQTVPCCNAVIVLRADGPDSFFVLTTYPEDRE
jgi:Bacterial CdiA-CT RNAse A domain